MRVSPLNCILSFLFKNPFSVMNDVCVLSSAFVNYWKGKGIFHKQSVIFIYLFILYSLSLNFSSFILILLSYIIPCISGLHARSMCSMLIMWITIKDAQIHIQELALPVHVMNVVPVVRLPFQPPAIKELNLQIDFLIPFKSRFPKTPAIPC